jgi:hypothetical protein
MGKALYFAWLALRVCVNYRDKCDLFTDRLRCSLFFWGIGTGDDVKKLSKESLVGFVGMER